MSLYSDKPAWSNLEDDMAGRAARYQAKRKAKKRKERARKCGFMKKSRPGGRLKKTRGHQRAF